MEPDEEEVDCSIDIDLIKDEQNPMYQNVNIHRQRLISVLDRALEKIGIAYALDELLGENIDELKKYVAQEEIDSIIKTFKRARRLEDAPMKILSVVMKRSALIKSHLNTKNFGSNPFHKSTTNLSASSCASMTSSQQEERGTLAQAQLIRNFYSSLIAKLHFNPEVSNLARRMIYKKPIGTIQYYIHFKDLRDHVCKNIYITKTDELNHQKNIQRAYVKNLKAKPQVEVINKLLEDRQKETSEMITQIRKDIENEKLVQAEMNIKLITDAMEKICKSEEQIIACTEESHIIQEENKIVYATQTAYYEKELAKNIATTEISRRKVSKLEVTLKKIMENYDTAIGKLHEDFEIINESFLATKALYTDLKLKFDSQEEEYEELMAEKNHFVEMTCLRIRYNRSAKIIQHWWRDILCKRWKWRKTYLAQQLKRKSLSPEQRKKMKKIIKKIKGKQKKFN